jgi:hypothetical protein
MSRLITKSAGAVLLFATLALSGCSASGTANATATKVPTNTARPQAQVSPPRTGASPTPDEPAAALREAANPDPNFDFGFVVQITPKGFHPQWLVSACCKAVTWKNLTGETVSVLFDHQLVDSGPIAPGATFVFTPHNVQSIAYHAGNNAAMIGVLQVNQTFES